MRQIAQNYRTGELTVLDAPAPSCKPGGVLVRNSYSLISTGTELMKVSEARLSLIGKAKARPDQVRKLVDSVAQQGVLSTYKKAMDRLDSYTPLGYSSCGVVIQVGAGAEDFRVGQLVACAGNEFALHADVNWVPKNLCVPVPDGVSPEHGAFATVGAIAMQGLRRAEAQIGETACVVGLGLIGQLLVRLLVANGIRVVGLDPVESRRALAVKAGAVTCAQPGGESMVDFERELADLTGGLGVDHVFLVAGGSSNDPVETAARLVRDRGRVVDIGKTSLDLPWNDYYEKELDVRFSRSYGPGRYDDTYELDGVDYPAGYVRWTERRNLESFLDLVSRGSVDLTSLVSEVFSLDEAADVYERLGSGSLGGVGYLFEYGSADVPVEDVKSGSATGTILPQRPARAPLRRAGGNVRLGFIGAGNYAASMLLPHLSKDERVVLARVVTTRGLSAVNAERKHGFAAVSTESQHVLEDDSLDAIFIVTRHHSHADFVCQALRTGKAVYVEKPLALDEEQVTRILTTVEETGNDRLMVGFNRRFAPLFKEVQSGVRADGEPAVARYLVNAGRLAGDSWYTNDALEGSRFAGEGGHFIDTLSALFDDDPVQVFATSTPSGDDLDVQMRFRRGSVASVTYVTNGNSRYPKETIDVNVGGRTARLDNFQSGRVWQGRSRSGKRSLMGQDKGQRAMLGAFIEAVQGDSSMPIPFDSLVQTTRATLAVEGSVGSGLPVQL